MSQNKTENSQSLLKKFALTFLQVAPLWGLIFLVNPAIVLMSSSSALINTTMLLQLLGIFMCLSITASIFIAYLPNRVHLFFLSLFQSSFIVLFVASVFFPTASEVLDGRSKTIVLFSEYLKNEIFHTTFLFLSIAALTYLFIAGKILKKVASNLFAVASFISLFFFLYFLVEAHPRINVSHDNNLDFSFGNTHNIIFIMADMLQGSTLEQLLINNPEDKEELDGFTLYSRASSPFPFTTYGVPVILSGDLYIDGKKAPQNDVMKHLQKNSFIHDASLKNYETTVASLDFMPIHKNQFSYGMSTVKDTSWSFLLTVRILDTGLQRIFHTCVINRLFPNLALPDYLNLYKYSSRDILESVSTAKIGPTSHKLLYLHSMVPHIPILFTSEKDFYSNHLEPAEDTVENYFLEARFFLGQLKKLFRQMKKLGIYDNSLIIISGDHGHFICTNPELYKNPKGTEDFCGFEKGPWARAVGMYNAAILIKPPASKHPLQILRNSASTTGIRPLVQQYLENSNQSESSFLDHFEKNSKGKIIVFKEKISSNPYQKTDDHIELAYKGNISDAINTFVLDPHAELYNIGDKHTPPHQYLYGSWICEGPGAWLTKPIGRVMFRTQDLRTSNPMNMRLELLAFTSEKHPEQKVKICINGKDIGVFAFRTNEKESYDVPIPSGVLLAHNTNAIEFIPLNPVSPKELNKWDFETGLCFFLYSFQLTSM